MLNNMSNTPEAIVQHIRESIYHANLGFQFRKTASILILMFAGLEIWARINQSRTPHD